MSGLFSLLTSAASALDAQRFGLDVVGQNMANVNTPGYTRRVIDFAEVPPGDPREAGRGVETVGVRAMRDSLLDRRLYTEMSSEGKDAAASNALTAVETAIGPSGASIDGGLQAFFDAFSDLAQDPTSGVARRGVQLRGASLATAFNDMSARLDESRHSADQQVRATTDDINSLVSRIAALNHSAAKEGALTVQDQQGELVRQLSALIDVSVLDRPQGGIDVTIGNGKPLVMGENAYQITTTQTPPNGMVALHLEGTDITTEITGGKIAGLIQVRDVSIPDYQTKLDTLAAGVVQQVNTLHTAGFDQAGAAGGNFFTYRSPIVGSAGAAKEMRLDGAIAADSRLIAAAGVPLAGDNQTARGIAALSSALVLNGNTSTMNGAWGEIVYSVGRDTSDASDAQKTGAAIVSQLETMRDSVSGVSLDEEAMNMLKFQRAYEANARLFRAADDMLTTLMNAL